MIEAGVLTDEGSLRAPDKCSSINKHKLFQGESSFNHRKGQTLFFFCLYKPFFQCQYVPSSTIGEYECFFFVFIRTRKISLSEVKFICKICKTLIFFFPSICKQLQKNVMRPTRQSQHELKGSRRRYFSYLKVAKGLGLTLNTLTLNFNIGVYLKLHSG